MFRQSKTISGSVAQANGANGPPPRQIFGYELLEPLGQGAATRLYAACANGSGQVLTLKHLICPDPYEPCFVKQLENELAVGRRVRHPNLRCAHELHIRRSLVSGHLEAALLLEFVDGQVLMPGDSGLEPGEEVHDLVSYFQQIASGLQHLHGLGYVHGDIKPGNLLVTPAGQVKVIDFGHACPIGTHKQRLQGTPRYMAPEQRSCGRVDERTDVYNLGMTMWRCLWPHGVDVDADGDEMRQGSPMPPHELAGAAREALWDLVEACLRVEPSLRPRGMGPVIRGLEAVQEALCRQRRLARLMSPVQ
jgi:eukaryotic-like serine/threonine-protein kinase